MSYVFETVNTKNWKHHYLACFSVIIELNQTYSLKIQACLRIKLARYTAV